MGGMEFRCADELCISWEFIVSHRCFFFSSFACYTKVVLVWFELLAIWLDNAVIQDETRILNEVDIHY